LKQLLLEIAAPPVPTLDNFVTGRNAELVAALRALAAGRPGERSVYLWGVGGSGRTHLLDGTIRAAAAAGTSAIRVEAGRAEAALDAAHACEVVAVDDVDLLDARAQLGLFALQNRLRERGGALIAAGSVAPAGLALRPDVATRLAWGVVYEVHALDDGEKVEAMRARARGLGFDLPAEVCGYVLRHARRDLGSLIAIVDALDRLSLETRRALTPALVREVLQLPLDLDEVR